MKRSEFDVELGPQCAIDGCSRRFEGAKPDDWGIVVLDNIMVHQNHPPYTFHMFFCPEHQIAFEQIENVDTKLEYAPGSGSFDICFYDADDALDDRAPKLRVEIVEIKE